MQGGHNAYQLCTEKGYLNFAQYFEPKKTDYWREPPEDVNTALHKAAQGGQLSIVEYLVESCGFDVTVNGKVG